MRTNTVFPMRLGRRRASGLLSVSRFVRFSSRARTWLLLELLSLEPFAQSGVCVRKIETIVGVEKNAAGDVKYLVPATARPRGLESQNGQHSAVGTVKTVRRDDGKIDAIRICGRWDRGK